MSKLLCLNMSWFIDGLIGNLRNLSKSLITTEFGVGLSQGAGWVLKGSRGQKKVKSCSEFEDIVDIIW